MSHDLHGKTALVTGAARRLGAAISRALAREGANVVLHYRGSGDDAARLRQELIDLGVQSWLVEADFEKPREYQTLIERSLQTAGGLDMLVNNASMFPPSSLEDVTFGDLTRNMQVNAWVPFELSRDFQRLVGRGRIVNLVDTRAHDFDPAHVAYILSKQALGVLTRATALRYAPEIAVNGIAPGLILPPPGEDEGYLERLAHSVPLQRHGSPEDVADAAIYLLKSDFLTGVVIDVDGGRHLSS